MYYRLKPTASAVPLADGRLLLKSDTQSIRLEGEFARLLQTTLLPALDGSLTVDDLALRLSLPPEALRANFDSLADSGLFERGEQRLEVATPDPRHNLLGSLGLSREQLGQRLSAARISLFGLDPLGAAIADALAAVGFGRLELTDPFPVQPLDLEPGEEPAVGSREDHVARRLRRRHPHLEVEKSGLGSLSRAATLERMRGCDLAIASWDAGMSSGNHWVNRASHELAVPALFCELRGTQVFAGPFVVPGMTACYMCFRMRTIAAETEYEEAMAWERHLDQVKFPHPEQREIFPGSIQTVASLLSAEAVKFILLSFQPALLGAVVAYQPFDLTLERHPLLEQPACPVCGEKKKHSRVHIPAWKS